jgi:putative ABC transport system permease protein
MSPREAFANAWKNIGSHRLRSALSMLGMIFGVGAVIAMLAIGAGAERQAMGMIEQLGVRNVLIRARELKTEEVAEIRKKSPGVAPRDLAAIAESVAGVDIIVPRVAVEPYRISAAGGRTKAKVWGVSASHAELFGLRVESGRFLDVLDERTHAQVCVIGAGVRRDLFGVSEALGQRVKVNDLWLEVVGVLASSEVGGAAFGGVQIASPAREILLPFTTVVRKLEREVTRSPLDEIVVRLKEGVSSTDSATVIRALLDRLHAGADDYELVVPEQLLEQSRRTQRLFAIVMGCIAGISLLVGGIGIMNIMLASVLERTREIGLRRAVGATRRDVRTQFVIEASLISSMGGLAGVLMGVIIARTVAASADWPTVVTPFSIILSFGVSLAVGLSSGIYPAMRAAQLDPIEALRYE